MPDLPETAVAGNTAFHETIKSDAHATHIDYKSVALRKAYGLANGNGSRSRKVTEDALPLIASANHQHSDGGRGHLSDGGHGDDGAEHPRRSHVVPESVLVELERLKTVVHEKERDIFQLKQEVGVLKHIERRQQRDLDQLQDMEEDAPRIIKLLREELNGFKLKLKQSNAIRTSDERLLRQYSEKINHLTERNEKYKKLLKERDLEAREFLTHELEAEKEKIVALEKTIADMQRKFELSSKNMGSENRTLRAKLGHTEKERDALKTQLSEIELQMKDKDKSLASLSIYRHKIVHGHMDNECKTCKKREDEKLERARKQEISAKIPKLAAPKVTVVNSTSLCITIELPKQSETCRFNRLKVIQFTDKTLSTSKDFYAEGVEDAKDSASVYIDGLTTGHVYYFAAQAVFDNCEGFPSDLVDGVSDTIPDIPPAPVAAFDSKSKSLTVSGFGLPQENGGSPVLGLNIYQFLSQEPASAEDDFSSATLVGRVQSIAETFTLKNPKLGFHHYFQVAATNVLGEGPKSIFSAGTYCDTTPDKPSKPKVKKLPKNTVMVHIQPPRSSGSGVSRFVIEWSKESEPQSPSEKSSRSGRKTPALESTNTLSNIPDAQRMEVDSSDLARALTDLDSGFTYRFRIIAKNACGQSVPSEFSDAVCLDDMLSTPTVPTVEIMSSTSVHVTMPDIQSFAHPSFIRKIAGFHVLASAEASMAEAHVVATVKIPSPSKKHAKSSKIGSPMGSETSLNGSSSSAPGPVLACVVSDLKKNGDYFIAVQCFGTISGIESRLSPSAWAPLATAVPLPAPSGSLDSIAPTTAHSAGKSSPMAADHSPSAGKYKGFMSPRSARAQFPNSAKDSQEVHASPPSSGRLVAKGTFVKNSTTATSSTDEVKKTGMSAKSSTVITASASTKRKSAGVAK